MLISLNAFLHSLWILFIPFFFLVTCGTSTHSVFLTYWFLNEGLGFPLTLNTHFNEGWCFSILSRALLSESCSSRDKTLRWEVWFNLHIHFLCILNDIAEVLLTQPLHVLSLWCGKHSKFVIVMRSLFLSFAIFHENVNLFHFISLQS